MADTEIDKLLRTLTVETFSRKDLDPWVRECRDIYSPGHRDAFIGNGLIGLRVPPEGEPSVYPTFKAVKMAPGGTQMYRLWDENGNVPAFNFMGLRLTHGRMVFRRDSGAITGYAQKLDWRNATVTTECDWHHWGGKVHIRIVTWLSRSRQNTGCVEMSLTSDYDTGFCICDIVDGSFIPEHSPIKYKLFASHVVPKVISSNFGGRHVAAATAVTVDDEPVPGEVELIPDGYQREIVVMLRKGETHTVAKYASMVTDEYVSDPVNAAAMAVNSAMSNPAKFRAEHEAAWAKLWEHRIEVDHPGVQMLANDALYHLYCNVDENGKGCVPGPAGLSGNAWSGHIFYDADTWSFPPAALMNPGMASNYVKYRVSTLPGARRNAAASGLDGALFPWEGGKSGDELVPGLIYSLQHHINSDVVQAAWNYYLASGDEDFIRNEGAELILAVADFWVSRVVYNAEKDRYEILKVCCPDEIAHVQDNNAFTNYGAKVTLLLAEKLVKKIGGTVNPKWREIAEKLWIPFDEKNQRIIEYEGYNGQTIKQADAILLIYPMKMPLSAEAKKNTCEYYRAKYEAQKIMMSSAIHGIIDAEIGDTESSWQMFLDLLKHFRGDYLLVSESPVNETMSLLTGLGGMMQLLMMGWGGLRLHEAKLDAKPSLPAEIKSLKILGVHYRGECYDLAADHFGYKLEKQQSRRKEF